MHSEFYEGLGAIRSAPHLIQLGRVYVNQACAQQPSQMDCNIRLPHPTRTIQKLAEDLFGEKRNHLPLFFRKVLDTYSVIENQCNKTILFFIGLIFKIAKKYSVD